MLYRIGAALAVLLFAVPASAQLPPAGSPVLNQAVSAAALTASDVTVFKQTRGLHVGDGSVCSIKVMFSSDSTAVVLLNMQPGGSYPYSIKQLYATGGTTCSAIIGLY